MSYTCNYEKQSIPRTVGDGSGVEYPVTGRQISVKNLVTIGNEEAALAERFTAINETLRAAKTPVRYVVFKTGDTFETRRIFEAVEEVGGTAAELFTNHERRGVFDDSADFMTAERYAAVTVYRIAKTNGALSVCGTVYAYRDYSETTWNIIKGMQEDYGNAYMRKPQTASEKALNMPFELLPMTEAYAAALAAIERKQSPLVIGNHSNARAFSKELELYETVSRIAKYE